MSCLQQKTRTNIHRIKHVKGDYQIKMISMYFTVSWNFDTKDMTNTTEEGIVKLPQQHGHHSLSKVFKWNQRQSSHCFTLECWTQTNTKSSLTAWHSWWHDNRHVTRGHWHESTRSRKRHKRKGGMNFGAGFQNVYMIMNEVHDNRKNTWTTNKDHQLLMRRQGSPHTFRCIRHDGRNFEQIPHRLGTSFSDKKKQLLRAEVSSVRCPVVLETSSTLRSLDTRLENSIHCQRSQSGRLSIFINHARQARIYNRDKGQVEREPLDFTLESPLGFIAIKS